MANVPKKGSPQVTDNWRGILVNSHIAKVVATKIYREVQSVYAGYVGCTQFGATPRMGTALAGHTLRLAMEIGKQRGWSCMLVFADLSKAFDKIVRESVLGWSDEVAPEDRHARLLEIGLSEGQAQALEAYLNEHGTAMEQAGARKAVVDLMRSLHSAAWFQVGSSRSAPVVTRRGGRQGCKLGPLVFNCGYELPLNLIRRKLAALGIGFRIEGTARCPWAAPPSVFEVGTGSGDWTGYDRCQSLTEVVYVDDVGFIVFCKTPFQLYSLAPRALQVLVDAFHMFGMELNLSKGKAEAFVAYRGKNQAKYKELLEQSGHIISIPGHEGLSISVVESYIHLGTRMAADSDANADVMRRVSSCMSSFAPIAVSILGRKSIPVRLRLQLATASCFPDCCTICTLGR